MHLAPKLGRSINLKQFGEWAVVTGATDGIGKGYVLALAAKGLNIVLVSRSEEKLKKVVAEIKQKFPSVQLQYIVHDFSNSDKAVEKMKSSLQDVYPKIGILVNNVGTAGKQFAGDFASRSDALDVAADVVQVNVNSMLLMTSIMLPEFIRRRKGVVVNICSISAIHPTAGMAVYNGTKAFMDFFSRSIRQENRKSNVLIQTVYPGLVKTKLVPDVIVAKVPSIMAPDYESFCTQCVATIGVLSETYGCLSHRLQAYFITVLKCLPLRFSDELAVRLNAIRMDDGTKTLKKVN